ncbi:MAG: hypothetical protein ACKV2V_12605 [Blastocatellia bacterium]
MRRIHALRYFAAAFAVSAALSLVSFAQAAAGGAPPKPAAAQG